MSVHIGSVRSNPVLTDAGAYLELTKPGVTRLVLVTTAAGALLAPGPAAVGRLLLTVCATALVVGAANTLNMLLEREPDAAMDRTRGRPLPSGRVSRLGALSFGLGQAVIGLGVLVGLSVQAGAWAAAALVSYVGAYTPLKRITPLSLYVGALPGAIPPLIGWSAMAETLSAPAWALFAILFAWQLPHFLAIALFRRTEYARAGFRVWSTVHGVGSTRIALVSHTLLLVAASSLPAWLGCAGWGYALCAGTGGVLLMASTVVGLWRTADDRWARRVFFASMPYLVAVVAALLATER